nr:hypothetical protein [Miltoncostaea marina]
MLAVVLQAHQVDDVHDPDAQVGQPAPEELGGGEGLHRRHVAGARHDDVGLDAGVRARPLPDSDALRAVNYGVVDVEVLQLGLLARHHDVDVLAAAQAVIDHRQQRVGVRRQVDTDDLGLLVDDVVDEPGVLMGEAVVILAPHVRGQQVVERRNRSAPLDVVGHLQPLGVLVEHRVDDVDEGFVAREEPMPAGEQVALEPALTKVLGQDLHHPPVGAEVVVRLDGCGVPGPIRDIEDGAEPVRVVLVRGEHPEGRHVLRHDFSEKRAEHPRRLHRPGARRLDGDRVVLEVGQAQVPQHPAAVRVGIGAHAPLAGWVQVTDGRHGGARLVEELLGAVAAQPPLQHLAVALVGARVGERHLV